MMYTPAHKFAATNHSRKEDMPIQRAEESQGKQVIVTDRDLNLLESASNFLETKSMAVNFAAYKHLMRGYAKSLAALRKKLEPAAVSDPVTLDELFNGRSYD